MKLSTQKTPTWLVWIIVAAAVLTALALGVWQYAHAVPPLHPDAQKVPSIAEQLPSPKWVRAVEASRQRAQRRQHTESAGPRGRGRRRRGDCLG